MQRRQTGNFPRGAVSAVRVQLWTVLRRAEDEADSSVQVKAAQSRSRGDVAQSTQSGIFHVGQKRLLLEAARLFYTWVSLQNKQLRLPWGT